MAAALKSAGLNFVSQEGMGHLEVQLPEGGSADLIWRLAKQHGLQIRHLAPATVSLEQAFEKALTDKGGGEA
ncbi:MAG: hypothetical protein JRJ87_14915 [Deltaproteobacteria bacterium]|nr:hypothetical protein [Deltaproteobacteria bacterium]